MSHARICHIARICHMPAYVTSPAYVTCPHMSHARICHMPAYVTSPAYVTCPHMSHSPYMSYAPKCHISRLDGRSMLVTTFQFTVRYKWSERKAPVLCTCFKIHYSFSMQKQKMIEMKSVYMSGNMHSRN